MDSKEILKEIESEIELTGMKKHENQPPEGSEAVEGFSPAGWRFMAVDFDTEDQGFPKGSRGYAGTAMKDNLIVNLTPQLAEKVFKNRVI